jgi:hypothetical protein
LKARFLRLYPAQSDIPVRVVKKNPSKQIFLTKKGGEKGVFPPSKIGSAKGRFPYTAIGGPVPLACG